MCGLERYTSLLVDALRSDTKYSINLVTPINLGPFAIGMSTKKINGKNPTLNPILHFRSQEIASVLIFKKYPKAIVTVHDLIPL